MTKNIAIIGSDMNGVLGRVSQFANCGAKVTLFLGASELTECDVVEINTNSKLASASSAYRKTRDAIKKCHGRHIYLQEDSSLRGNLSSNIRAVIDD